MKALWILFFASLCLYAVGDKDLPHRLKIWQQWNQIKRAVVKQASTYDCSVLAKRLLDWFHILRTSHIKQQFERRGISLPLSGEVIPRMRPKEAKMPFPLGFDQSQCREPIKTVFQHVLDQNHDGVLDSSELADMYEIGNEAECIKEFFKNCSNEKETFTQAEFCSCFAFVEPPCFQELRKNLPYLLVRGVPRPVYGYTPACDQDGFYMPRQCRATGHRRNKECWCVDRHGRRIEGLTECVDNTEPPTEEEPEEPKEHGSN